MRRLSSLLVFFVSGMALLGCASGGGFAPESWKFHVDGKVNSISRADLATAIAAADAKRVYGVHVINRNRVHVDISDDIHDVGEWDERGRYVLRRYHGDPMYTIVKRVHGKWESSGGIITTY